MADASATVWVMDMTRAAATIEIAPAQGRAWMVRSDALASPLFFNGQGSAESGALRLAQGLAEAGRNVTVCLLDAAGEPMREVHVAARQAVWRGPVVAPT